jgi:hypothetical protein
MIMGVSVLLVVTVMSWVSRPQQSYRQPSSVDTATARSSTTSASSDPVIEKGRVGGIEYYACRTDVMGSGSAANSETKTLLLFHGAAFTKENWKKSGILQQLCGTGGGAQSSSLVAYALDLPVSATPNEFRSLLDAMQRRGLLRLPADTVVTPSASGKAVVQWNAPSLSSPAVGPGGGGSLLPPMREYMRLWMPIASPAVASVSPPSDLASRFPDVEVVAVYGDQDSGGKRTMQLLHEHVEGAELVELKGRHPCYLDSPDGFVELVRTKMRLAE